MPLLKALKRASVHTQKPSPTWLVKVSPSVSPWITMNFLESKTNLQLQYSLPSHKSSQAFLFSCLTKGQFGTAPSISPQRNTWQKWLKNASKATSGLRLAFIAPATKNNCSQDVNAWRDASPWPELKTPWQSSSKISNFFP